MHSGTAHCCTGRPIIPGETSAGTAHPETTIYNRHLMKVWVGRELRSRLMQSRDVAMDLGSCEYLLGLSGLGLEFGNYAVLRDHPNAADSEEGGEGGSPICLRGGGGSPEEQSLQTLATDGNGGSFTSDSYDMMEDWNFRSGESDVDGLIYIHGGGPPHANSASADDTIGSDGPGIDAGAPSNTAGGTPHDGRNHPSTPSGCIGAAVPEGDNGGGMPQATPPPGEKRSSQHITLTPQNYPGRRRHC